jgi:cell division protein FtsI (penicillin-binding protein 3)
MDTKKDILLRVYLLYFGVSIFCLAIVAKIAHLQVAEGDYWRKKAEENTTEFKIIEASRGNIYADDGVTLLATDLPYYEIHMDVKADGITTKLFNANVDSLAFCLSQLFNDKSARAYRNELVAARKEGSRYHLIHRNVNYTDLKKLKNFPLFRLGKYKGGLIIMQTNKRKMPFQMLAKRTIGYKLSNVNPVGLEGAYNEQLKGKEGKRLMQKLAGNIWLPINDANEVEPQDGKDLVTTIDVNIQDVAEHALESQLKEQLADHGCVVLMEVKTGEVKAIANLTKGKDGNYNETYNYAIGESMEPGSTFKLASLMAAMEDGLIDLNDKIDIENGTTTFYNRIMRDSHHPKEQIVTVQRVFEESSNVGISKLITNAYSKNPQKYIDRLYRFHLNDTLGLDLAGESRPFIKDTKHDNWSGVSLPWMSIGYEVKLTPLQILTFYNSVANGGTMVKPRFVKEMRYRGQTLNKFEPVIIDQQICSRGTIAKARKLMEAVVENGTAKNLKNPFYKVAGKTGTVQKIVDGKYSKNEYGASFVGYFPADNPMYSCIVVISHPQKEIYYGGLVSAPVFRAIADRVYATSLKFHHEMPNVKNDEFPFCQNGNPYDLKQIFEKLNLPADNSVLSSSKYIAAPVKDEDNKVPDVNGMGLRDAIFILENKGLIVKCHGRGVINQQSLQPGTGFTKGAEIILELI